MSLTYSSLTENLPVLFRLYVLSHTHTHPRAYRNPLFIFFVPN